MPRRPWTARARVDRPPPTRSALATLAAIRRPAPRSEDGRRLHARDAAPLVGDGTNGAIGRASCVDG